MSELKPEAWKIVNNDLGSGRIWGLVSSSSKYDASLMLVGSHPDDKAKLEDLKKIQEKLNRPADSVVVPRELYNRMLLLLGKCLDYSCIQTCSSDIVEEIEETIKSVREQAILSTDTDSGKKASCSDCGVPLDCEADKDANYLCGPCGQMYGL